MISVLFSTSQNVLTILVLFPGETVVVHTMFIAWTEKVMRILGRNSRIQDPPVEELLEPERNGALIVRTQTIITEIPTDFFFFFAYVLILIILLIPSNVEAGVYIPYYSVYSTFCCITCRFRWVQHNPYIRPYHYTSTGTHTLVYIIGMYLDATLLCIPCMPLLVYH
jgi:hypothetical protein